ncbi:hypothetical protein B0H19DRAFT_1139907 [Mycena capillaripes]|nr:hypothetical protein B0H19DRAFT_1139907 [Mycena capillaripes]
MLFQTLVLAVVLACAGQGAFVNAAAIRRVPGGVYDPRDTPEEDPTQAPNGGVIVYGRRDTPAENPVTAPGGGVIPYDPRDTIAA